MYCRKAAIQDLSLTVSTTFLYFNLDMVEEITKEISLEMEENREGFFMRLWANLKKGLLGTLYVMANDTAMSFKVNLAGMFIDFC
jgi:hypothetical protein